jgi:hypothetical protein
MCLSWGLHRDEFLLGDEGNFVFEFVLSYDEEVECAGVCSVRTAAGAPVTGTVTGGRHAYGHVDSLPESLPVSCLYGMLAVCERRQATGAQRGGG